MGFMAGPRLRKYLDPHVPDPPVQGPDDSVGFWPGPLALALDHHDHDHDHDDDDDDDQHDDDYVLTG